MSERQRYDSPKLVRQRELAQREEQLSTGRLRHRLATAISKVWQTRFA